MIRCCASRCAPLPSDSSLYWVVSALHLSRPMRIVLPPRARTHTQIREETRRLEFAEGSKTILAIIAQTQLERANDSEAAGEQDAAGGLVHHVWHDERQRIFNELILDQRTKEGDFIHNLASLVNGQQVRSDSLTL